MLIKEAEPLFELPLLIPYENRRRMRSPDCGYSPAAEPLLIGPLGALDDGLPDELPEVDGFLFPVELLPVDELPEPMPLDELPEPMPLDELPMLLFDDNVTPSALAVLLSNWPVC